MDESFDWTEWFNNNWIWLREIWYNRLHISSWHQMDVVGDSDKLQQFNLHPQEEKRKWAIVLQHMVLSKEHRYERPNASPTYAISGFVEQMNRLPKEGEFIIFYDKETTTSGRYTIGIPRIVYILTQTTMLQQHTLPNGQRMLIAEMSDEQLYETVHRILSTAIAAKERLDATAQVDQYNAALYGITPATPENVAEIVREAITRSYPYLAECYLRGIDGQPQEDDVMEGTESLREMLQQVTGREGRLESSTPSQMLLGPGNYSAEIKGVSRSYNPRQG